VAEARPAFSASTKLGIQPNTLEPAEAGTALIRSNVAVQGAVLYAGINDSNQTAVWAGSETFPFYGALDDPVLDCANLDYAIGSYSGLGSNHYTCFIWPYRTNGSITPLPNCVLLSESKTGDLFFDQMETA
jgi:hypothetical protein